MAAQAGPGRRAHPELGHPRAEASGRARSTLATLLALPVVFWRPITRGETLYQEDLAAQYFPREQLLRTSGLSGWNPHEFLGLGLASDPQTAAYEPVRALARQAGLADRLGLVLYLGVYLTIATGGAWALARRFGASTTGAALAVLAFVWGGSSSSASVTRGCSPRWRSCPGQRSRPIGWRRRTAARRAGHRRARGVGRARGTPPGGVHDLAVRRRVGGGADLERGAAGQTGAPARRAGSGSPRAPCSSAGCWPESTGR